MRITIRPVLATLVIVCGLLTVACNPLEPTTDCYNSTPTSSALNADGSVTTNFGQPAKVACH